MKEKGEKKFKQSYLKAPVEPFVLLMGLFQQQDYRVSQFPGYYYFLFFFCTENKKGRSKKYCINPHYFPLLRVSVQLHLHQKWWIFFWNYFFFFKHLQKVFAINHMLISMPSKWHVPKWETSNWPHTWMAAYEFVKGTWTIPFVFSI